MTHGDTVQYGDLKVIENEGMPVYKDPFTKGNLVIIFDIELPNRQWIMNNRVKLEKLLPKKKDQIGKYRLKNLKNKFLTIFRNKRKIRASNTQRL